MSTNKVGAVLVLGSGIAGIQASLDLAESGYYVYLVEKKPAIGGTMPMLDKTFPTNDCSMCILSPKLVDCGRHLNIQTLTGSELIDLQGEPGNFKATVLKKARFIDTEKCTGCSSCAQVCPVKTDEEFNQGLAKRKAVYKLYAQAFPNAYAIDPQQCLRLRKGYNPKVCGKCLDACQAGAINHQMKDETIELEVGSVILMPGFEPFEAQKLEYYGYGRIPNVLTSLEFERILSASGPFGGHLQRPSDGKEPKKIAWIQCVGSRNCRLEHNYCSSVCCMYAIKEAVIAKEHTPYELDTAIFYMDMRTYGKEFEKYYDKAKDQNGVRFIRSRVFEIRQAVDETGNINGTGDVNIRYSLEDGSIVEEDFDLAVLSIGLEAPKDMIELAQKLGVELNEFNFAKVPEFTGVGTSKPGIFVAGAFSGPRDIPETVMQASAAAADSAAGLSEVRGTMVKKKEYPPEKDVIGEKVRMGVFVCHCGINIGSVVNVPEVVKFASTLPGVVCAEEKTYACSQDSCNQIKEAIAKYDLNRVVVASCTPRTHEPLFQDTIKEAGLNPNLFEMANIRDHCSWVHQKFPAEATEKAKDLVKMAVYKAALLEPVQPVTVEMNHDALVIGGGISGMTAAMNMAEQGFKVSLVEREAELGGWCNKIRFGMEYEDVRAYITDLKAKIEANDLIDVYLGSQIVDAGGFVGNFTSTLQDGTEIKHAVTIIATGAKPFKSNEYLNGQHDKVLSLMQQEAQLAEGSLGGDKNIVFVQCVGSREPDRPYCSRICCTKSINQAIQIKKMDPSANVFILYRDIRTYGMHEKAYTEARRLGVVFIRYSVNNKPQVTADGDKLDVVVTDHVLGVPVKIKADRVVLAAAMIPEEGNKDLSKLYKVPLNAEGFFLEAHLKLRPVDFSTDGVFVCGTAHAPKTLDENISQAKAAVSRACTVLAKEAIVVEGKCAVVNKRKCVACGNCEAVCPAKAITVNLEERVAVVNEALCKGCGACSSSCRCGALNIKGFTNEQIMAMVNSL